MSHVPSFVPKERKAAQRKAAEAASSLSVSTPVGGVLAHAGPAFGLSDATELPHAARIQAAFGRHNLSGVKGHVGEAAAAHARSLGAAAYTTGNHVVFGREPSLRLAAHEAAHVVQQRAGIRLPGGIGQAGDVYEQHADAVADRVVAGGSAEALLNQQAGTGAAVPAPGQIQRALPTYSDIPEFGAHNRWGDFYTDSTGGKARGRRAKVEGAAKDWKTRVTWQPAVTDDGTGMEANPLGPDHPLGSEPASGDKAWNRKRNKQQERADHKEGYKAGHLLNDELGGPGDDVRNLAAIPTSANAQHSAKVEQKLKKIVNEEHGWVYYKVTTDQDTDGATPGKPKYTSALHCTWYQLDPTTWTKANPSAAMVPGTDGQVDIAIPPPSYYAGGGLKLQSDPTVTGAGSALETRAVGAAWTKVSRQSVVLASTEKISAQTLVMGPINDLLDKMQISEFIQSVPETELTKNLSAIIKATDLSKTELDAYKLIDAEKEKLENLKQLGETHLATYDPPPELGPALESAPLERGKRYQLIYGKVKALYELLHGAPNATDLLKVVEEAWAKEDTPRKQTEQLCSLLLKTATELKKQYQSSVTVGISHVDMTRGFLDMTPVDTSVSLQDQVKMMEETEPFDQKGVEQVVYQIAPMSPLRLQEFDEEMQEQYPKHEKTKKQSPHVSTWSSYKQYMKERRGSPYLKHALKVSTKHGLRQATGADKKLIELLEDQQGKEATAKEAVRQVQIGYQQLAPLVLTYLEALEAGSFKKARLAAEAITNFYSEDPRGVRDLYEHLKTNL